MSTVTVMVKKIILALLMVISMSEISPEIQSIVENTSKQFSLDPALVFAIIRQESDFDANSLLYEPALSDYSLGLMQVLYNTAKDMGFKGTQGELIQPAINIYYGCRYLKSRLDKYGLNGGIVSYNSGSPIVITADYIAKQKAKLATLTGSDYTTLKNKIDDYSGRMGQYINQKYLDNVLKYYAEYKQQYAVTSGTPLVATVGLGIALGLFGIFIFKKLMTR